MAIDIGVQSSHEHELVAFFGRLGEFEQIFENFVAFAPFRGIEGVVFEEEFKGEFVVWSAFNRLIERRNRPFAVG